MPFEIIDATFGSTSIGETTHTHDLLPALRRGMILLADRNFAARDLIAAIAHTGADLLIRVKTGCKLPVCRQLGNGSYVSRIGSRCYKKPSSPRCRRPSPDSGKK